MGANRRRDERCVQFESFPECAAECCQRAVETTPQLDSRDAGRQRRQPFAVYLLISTEM